jgi:hypothetical protein
MLRVWRMVSGKGRTQMNDRTITLVVVALVIACGALDLLAYLLRLALALYARRR